MKVYCDTCDVRIGWIHDASDAEHFTTFPSCVDCAGAKRQRLDTIEEHLTDDLPEISAAIAITPSEVLEILGIEDTKENHALALRWLWKHQLHVIRQMRIAAVKTIAYHSHKNNWPIKRERPFMLNTIEEVHTVIEDNRGR